MDTPTPLGGGDGMRGRGAGPDGGSGDPGFPDASLAPDSIAALATAPGVGAVALVRLSGGDALAIATRLCPESPGAFAPRRPSLVGVRDPETGELLDRALLTYFPAPESYTGEDVVEISGHGGPLTPVLVLEACLAAGARRAEPGEFTRRAYLNGKLDLVQAEAVADLVEGGSRALQQAALHQLDRGLSVRLGALREDLLRLEALLTHHLDFPEEDEPPVSLGRVAEQAREVASSLAALLDTAPSGELLREGALTVLVGRPNSGKSSLFNALLGIERAIVTDVPGTTRDALEAVVSMGRFPFRLVDTAGLRESEDRVERKGIEVARRYLDGADVVLLCVEAGRELEGEEWAFLGRDAGPPVVLVRTKCDLSPFGEEEDRSSQEEEPPEGTAEGPSAISLRTSAWTGEGLGRLRKLLPGLVYRGAAKAVGETPIVTRRRQARGIRRALREVRAFAEALEGTIPPEVAATHLRPAETALEEILGVISPDDVLDRVFRDFCIGK